MDSAKVDQYILMMSSKIPATSIPMVKEKLLACEDEGNIMVAVNQMKDPTIALILSIIIGCWGVDRFYIGDVGLGLGKLFTCGGCYIWWLIDIFLIMEATRTKNLEYINLIR